MDNHHHGFGVTSNVGIPDKVLGSAPWTDSSSSQDQDTSGDPFYLAPQQCSCLPASSRGQAVWGVELKIYSPPPAQGRLISAAQPTHISPSSTSDTLLSDRSIINAQSINTTKTLLGTSPKGPQKLNVEKLAKICQCFREAQEARKFSQNVKKHLLGWSEIFNSKSAFTAQISNGLEDASLLPFEAALACRLRRLGQARKDLPKKNWANTRLWLLFVAHEIEHISRSEHITLYTTRGVDTTSAAIKMAAKYLDDVEGDYKRSRNILHILERGGPALLLEDGGVTQSRWEKFINQDEIKYIFTYILNDLMALSQEADSYNSVVSDAIVARFREYGWSEEELRNSETRVMLSLKLHVPSLNVEVQLKTPYSDVTLRNSELCWKRQRTDRIGNFVFHPQPDSPAASFQTAQGTLSPGTGPTTRMASDLANSVPFGARTRELTDPAMIATFAYAVQGAANNLSDPATVNVLNQAINDLDQLTDPASAHLLQCVDNYLPSDLCEPTPLINSSVVECSNGLDWIDKFTESSTEEFFQGATSESRLVLSQDTDQSSMIV